MFTLAFLEPGHFHAALTLRERHPLVRDEVFVYAPPGPELDAFLELLRAFNARAQQPTEWRPTVYAGKAPLERLVAERNADAVVLAGRNDTRMGTIRRLHAAGLHVLADKPWVTGPECLADLEATMDAAGALAMDIMTSHHELSARLQRLLVGRPEVFGTFRTDTATGPAISIESTHHLYKRVNGVPLVRPPWYFDIRVQGDGIVDVPTHLVDAVQRIVGEPSLDFARDIALEQARRWATPVPRERFTQITQVADFPDALAPCLRDGVLHLLCNGELTYRLRGIPVRLRSEWHPEEPPGGGDTQHSRLRGTRAEIIVAHGPETGFVPRVSVLPNAGEPDVEADLRRAVAAWQGELPGLAVAHGADGELVLEAPTSLHLSHEAQFARVLDDFLSCLRSGEWPRELAPALRCKYTLLARAAALARASG